MSRPIGWIVGAYTLVSALWIWLSDRAVLWLFSAPQAQNLAQTIKGWLFVGVTAGILGLALRGLMRSQQDLARREIEAQQREARTSVLLQALAQASPDAIFAKDRDGRYLWFNRQAARFVGRDSAQVIGSHDEAVFSPSHAALIRANDLRVIEDDRAQTFEEELDTAAGRLTFLATKGPLRDANGAVIGVFGISRDITEMVAARRQLAESERRYRELFETNPHPMWVYDCETLAFLAVNEAAVHQYGYSREEFLHLTLRDIRPPHEVPRLLKATARVHQGIHKAGTWIHLTRDGREIEVEITSHTMTMEGRRAEWVLALDVTRRNRAERTLRDSEERLRLALQAANQGLFDRDLSTGQAVVSPEYARMLGWEPEAFAESDAAWRERLHPDDREEVQRIYEEYVAGRRKDCRAEFRMRTRDGGWKWILSLGRIQERDAEGRPMRMLGTHTDITAIKQTQQALEDSETRLRLLFEASPVPTLVHERDSLRIVAVNQAFTALYGYSRDEALRLTIIDLHPPEQRALGVETMGRTADLDPVVEAQHLSKDGRRIQVEAHTHDFSLDGRPGRISVIVDVTERRRAEAERRAAAERFEKLFVAAPEAISLSELDGGRFLQVNEAFCQLFGYGEQEVIGRTSLELGLWTQVEGRSRIVARLRAGESVRGFEGLARHRSGAPIDVSFSAEMVRVGESECLLLMFRDITESKRSEVALRRSEQRFRLAAASGRVWEWDFETGPAEQWAEFFGTLGYASEPPEGNARLFESVVQPDDLVELRRLLVRHLKRQGPYQTRFRARDAQGRTRWFETQGQAIWNDQGRAIYMAGTTFEITERHAAEQALLDSQSELFELSQRLLFQERDTNLRLAQSLHDRLGQNLASARLYLDLVRAGLPVTAEAAVRPLDRLSELLDLAVGEVRSTLVALRPPLLDAQGLATALRIEMSDHEVSLLTTRVSLEVHPYADTRRWPEAVEYSAFMIAREAVANALRHARASKVDVVLGGAGGSLDLVVGDDGIGIGDEAMHGRPGHLGIVGMRERALGIGGRLEVGRKADGGTAVRLSWEQDGA